jgi:tetratricopeptide (TPR) repeat protein
MAERKDVLSTFFWLTATWMYVAWVRRPATWRYGALVALTALGLMSKPMVVTLPFTLLLLDVWPLGRANVPLSRRVLEKAPLFAMVVLMAVVTAIVQQHGGAVSTVELVPIPERLVNAIVATGHYLLTFVWPVNLAVFYPYVKQWPAATVTAASIAIAVISVLAWRVRRAQPYVLIGWLWFLGTLVPVIGLVQFGTHAYADRYTYLPYVGLAIAIAWGARSLVARGGSGAPALRAAGVALVVALAIVAHTQAATWRTAETVWQHAAAVTDGNARAHNLLGVIYANRGETEAATAQFQAALNSNPDAADARDILPNLARSLMAQGRVADALPLWARAVRLKPDQADLRHQLALANFGVGHRDDAIAAWREAVRLNPNFEDAWFTMGIVLAGSRRTDEAREAFEQVLRINPGRKDATEALIALKK